jgi:NDP-4-keto-2,6-dideoxyhexose 3-C-methyltransferase
MRLYTALRRCRLCRSRRLQRVLRYPRQYVSSVFVRPGEKHPLDRRRIPMTVLLCRNCGLCQLRETVAPGLLFRNYAFRSDVNETARENAAKLAASILSRVRVKPGDVVLDIGCNDGLALSAFPRRLRRLGVDRARIPPRRGLGSGVRIIRKPFPLRSLPIPRAKILLCLSTLYEFDDLAAAVREMKNLLSPNGILCVQAAYLGSTLKNGIYNDFCHEHLCYFTLKTMVKTINEGGMHVSEAVWLGHDRTELRVFARTGGGANSAKVEREIRREERNRFDKPATFRRFESRIRRSVIRAKRLIDRLAVEGPLVGLGASTKGNVLLQLCGIGDKKVPFIADRNRNKIGSRPAGTRIRVISEKAARQMNPAVFIAFPWALRKAIVRREAAFLRRGLIQRR